MKRLAIVGAAGALCVLLAVPGLAYAPQDQAGRSSGQTAQQRHPDKKKEQAKEKGKAQKKAQEKNKSQETARKPQSRGEDRPQQARPRQPQKEATPPRRTTPPTERRAQPRPSTPPRQQPRTSEQRRTQEAQQRSIWRRHRARDWASQHRTWKQRGGYTGYRIPASYFRLYYGPSHWFRVYRLPFVYVAGYPRFQYAGYWFVVLDPIPEYWGAYWYEYDDVYIAYVDDGYYLFNRRWPHRPGVAITIVLRP